MAPRNMVYKRLSEIETRPHFRNCLLFTHSKFSPSYIVSLIFHTVCALQYLVSRVSVKVEAPELACPEEGCGFEADTFNMLLFHQGWGPSFKPKFRLHNSKTYGLKFFFRLVTHIRTDIL